MTGAPGREASAPYPDAMFPHQGSSPTPAAPTGNGQASLGAGEAPVGGLVDLDVEQQRPDDGRGRLRPCRHVISLPVCEQESHFLSGVT